MTRTSKGSVIAAMGCAVVAAMAPGIADADSLVFVKDGQVYVGNADGSQARPVTAKSTWAWPSESDNGTIAAAGGDERVNPGGTTESSGASEVYAFDQHGNALLSAPVHTPGSVSGPTAPTYVSHFRISPDASTVAYTVLGCCGMSGASTFISPMQAASSGWTDFQDDYIDPGWVDASSVPGVDDHHGLALTHNGIPAWGNAEYAVYKSTNRNAGDGLGWGEDAAIPDGWGFEVAFARTVGTVALFLDDSANNGGTAQHVQIHLEKLNNAVGGANTDYCTITLPAAQYPQPRDLSQASPSFSTDGSILAWGQADGIYEANVANPADCNAISGSTHLVVPGGSMPSFGAAPLSAPVVVKPTASLRVPRRVRAGRKIRLDGSLSHEAGGRLVRYRWAFGDGHGAAGRTVTHAYKRRGRYMVRLTVTDASGRTATARRAITVTR